MTKHTFATVLLLIVLAPATASGSREQVRNPLLTSGSQGKPVAWAAEAYKMTTSVTTFGWSRDESGIGVLEIDSKAPNDARYVQSVPVSPDTWYRISGWGRTEDVGRAQMGLNLSVMGTFHNSRDLRGTIGWQPLGLWVKTGSLDTKIQIACRLGGYSSLNTGKGWCTGLSVVAAGRPPENRTHVYGSEDTSASLGDSFGVQAIGLLVVLGIVLLIWRYVLPPSKQIPE